MDRNSVRAGGESRPPFAIRAAQPRDKRAVRRLCAGIWSGDYVPELFDEWVRDREGRCWVAVEGRAVVGIAKLSLSNGEAWLHGLRVDPAHRRRGIATALLDHRLARARRLGARVARLDTSEDNVAVQRLMRRYGFRRIARVGHYGALASEGPRPRTATQRDVSAAWRLLRSQRALLHRGHVVRTVQRDDVVRAIREGRCHLIGPSDPSAVAIVDQVLGHPRGSLFFIEAITGTPSGMRALLRALRAEAKARRFPRVLIAAPATQWVGARGAGYRRRWPETMFMFERRL